MAERAPYGSWTSPIPAERIAAGSVRLGSPHHGPDGSVTWTEGRPAEGGRSVLVSRSPSGETADLTPPPFNARSRVHEYGGGASWPHDGTIYFVNFDDQRIYRIDPTGEIDAVTPEPDEPGSVRYADGRVSPDGATIICVRERHRRDGEVINELVALPAAGPGEAAILASGRDFYSSPRISPDGSALAWIEWSHPQMPWDGTELKVAELTPGSAPALGAAETIAGGPAESVWQPEWSPDGELHHVSDRSGYWNIYDASGEAVVAEEAEYGYPHWVFGGSTFAFTSAGEIVCIRIDQADERLCLIEAGRAVPFELPFSSYGFPSLDVSGRSAVFAAAGPAEPAAIVELDIDSGEWSTLKHSMAAELDPGDVSVPRTVEFPTTEERTAHAFYYPPANARFEGLEGERPPLIVQIHGGPSAHATAEFALDTLYWTTRGFAVVDVNYGGSTGFGRAYRERLRETWGITDTADCLAAARHLAERGEVDGERLAIHGGSAGGYTTLCALCFGDAFSAGASYYGVADAETLATDTHKFESRYLDGLIGPYPQAAETYKERSPIHFVDRIRAAVIVLQGLEDEVVPPSQAEQIVAALADNGTPHAYLAFEGEQHGFRRAETIVRAHEAELYFYGRIFGFVPADEIEPVEIAGIPADPPA